jgi:hypothetical protein
VNRELVKGDMVKIKNLSATICANLHNNNLFIVDRTEKNYPSWGAYISFSNVCICKCIDCSHYLHCDYVDVYYLELVRSKLEREREGKLNQLLKDD